MITDSVRDHYIARWGPPSRRATFGVDGLDAEVLKWDAASNPEGVNLYATVGASARPMPDVDATHRIEFFIGFLPAQDGIASSLAALALFPARQGVALDHGHTVPANGPLWPGTDRRCLLVLRQRGDVIGTLEAPDGIHVEFMQAIPISESELAYKKRHGADSLLAKWEESAVPFWDPDRDSVPSDTLER
jgi:hypothetical protein